MGPPASRLEIQIGRNRVGLLNVDPGLGAELAVHNLGIEDPTYCELLDLRGLIGAEE